MVYINTWNSTFESVPDDADDIGDGAGGIRDLKVAIRERLDKDHYMNISGTDADHGEHKKVTLRQQAADPSNAASKGLLYTKTINSVVELFYRDSAGTITQLTSDGLIGGSTGHYDVISEVTSAAGVTIDGVKLKDGIINTINSVPYNCIPPYNLPENRLANNSVDNRVLAPLAVRDEHLPNRIIVQEKLQKGCLFSIIHQDTGDNHLVITSTSESYSTSRGNTSNTRLPFVAIPLYVPNTAGNIQTKVRCFAVLNTGGRFPSIRTTVLGNATANTDLISSTNEYELTFDNQLNDTYDGWYTLYIQTKTNDAGYGVSIVIKEIGIIMY